MSKIKKSLAVLTLSVSSFAMAAPIGAGAEAAPAGVQAPAMRYNGCTGVPDSGPTFNFTSACNWHDWCYDTHPYGGGSSGRLSCDQGFLARMNNYCEAHHGRFNPARYICKDIATRYYLGVRALGGSHF